MTCGHMMSSNITNVVTYSERSRNSHKTRGSYCSLNRIPTDRKHETDRQTDKQTDRQAEKQIDKTHNTIFVNMCTFTKCKNYHH